MYSPPSNVCDICLSKSILLNITATAEFITTFEQSNHAYIRGEHITCQTIDVTWQSFGGGGAVPENILQRCIKL